MFKVKNLRKLRIGVAFVFLIAFVMIFLDQRNNLPAWFRDFFLFFQFAPSVLNFFTVATIAASGFIVITILTFLFGRLYCSFLCPLGILQDIITRLSGLFRKKKKKIKFRFLKARNILRYSILVVTVIAAASGFIILLGWLDPYSIFGRFITHAIRPAYIYINNVISGTLYGWNVFSLHPLDFRAFSVYSFLLVIVFMIAITWMAAFWGRQYCNTICPVGALLGLMSKYSLFKIRLDHTQCNSCGLCQNACKAGCINAKEKSVDMTRCVACFNCLSSCRQNGVLYEPFMKSKSKDPVDESRRKFLAGSASLLIAGSGMANVAQSPDQGSPTLIPEEKEFPVSPPGSKSLDHFISKCIACHLCVSVCPKQVLQPSLLQYGLKGFLQPHMDYHTSYCNFDCILCGEVCPTGAILPLSLDEKHVEQIGKVVFIRRNCIVRTDLTDCGACSEHCPTKAVEMIPWRRVLLIPRVHPEICIGCGACEFACPTKPYKAIYVDGNKIHQKAERPVIEEQKIQKNDDFPF